MSSSDIYIFKGEIEKIIIDLSFLVYNDIKVLEIYIAFHFKKSFMPKTLSILILITFRFVEPDKRLTMLVNQGGVNNNNRAERGSPRSGTVNL